MISIVTVSHGHHSDIEKLVASLAQYLKLSYELILIDNLNSGFDFEGLCHRFNIANFKVIKNISPMSFSVNNNIGVSLCSYDNVVLLNPDICLIDDSLDHYLTQACMEQQGIDDGLFFPALVNLDGSKQINGKAKPNFFDQVVTFFASIFAKKRESPAGDYWYFAAAVIFNKPFFYQLGGFDINFPMYAEDTEICDRCHAVDAPVVLVNNISLQHGLGGDSKSKYIAKAVRSNIYLRYKMYKNKQLSKIHN